MRYSYGFYISLGVHVLLFALAVVWGNGSSVNVDLDRPAYTVDLVTLSGGGPKKSAPKAVKAPEPPKPAPEAEPKPAPVEVKPAPAPEVKAEPVPEPAPEVKPEPKPAPKPEPKPEPKDISPKKVDKPTLKKAEPKPEPKPKPAPKPQKTASQLIQEGLTDVRKQVRAEERKEQQALADEMASLRQEVGNDVYQADSEGEGGGSGGGVGSGLSEVYALIVGSAIKKNWRYPAFAGDANIRATVEIELSPDGHILSSRLVESSGVPEFDNSTIRAVKETEQVEPPRTERDRTIRINFNSQELGE